MYMASYLIYFKPYPFPTEITGPVWVRFSPRAVRVVAAHFGHGQQNTRILLMGNPPEQAPCPADLPVRATRGADA